MSRSQLNFAYNQARRQRATLEVPTIFEAKGEISFAPFRLDTIKPGATVKVHQGRDHAYVRWQNPGETRWHIWYE
jgi:hypothetical protein